MNNAFHEQSSFSIPDDLKHLITSPLKHTPILTRSSMIQGFVDITFDGTYYRRDISVSCMLSGLSFVNRYSAAVQEAISELQKVINARVQQMRADGCKDETNLRNQIARRMNEARRSAYFTYDMGARMTCSEAEADLARCTAIMTSEIDEIVRLMKWSLIAGKSGNTEIVLPPYNWQPK